MAPKKKFSDLVREKNMMTPAEEIAAIESAHTQSDPVPAEIESTSISEKKIKALTKTSASSSKSAQKKKTVVVKANGEPSSTTTDQEYREIRLIAVNLIQELDRTLRMRSRQLGLSMSEYFSNLVSEELKKVDELPDPDRPVRIFEYCRNRYRGTKYRRTLRLEPDVVERIQSDAAECGLTVTDMANYVIEMGANKDKS